MHIQLSQYTFILHKKELFGITATFLTVLLSPENRPKCNKIIFITDTYTFSTNRIQFTWKSNSKKKFGTRSTLAKITHTPI